MLTYRFDYLVLKLDSNCKSNLHLRPGARPQLLKLQLEKKVILQRRMNYCSLFSGTIHCLLSCTPLHLGKIVKF
ncbi:hypothetical protein IC582_026578 [Cucumis melo]